MGLALGVLHTHRGFSTFSISSSGNESVLYVASLLYRSTKGLSASPFFLAVLLLDPPSTASSTVQAAFRPHSGGSVGVVPLFHPAPSVIPDSSPSWHTSINSHIRIVSLWGFPRRAALLPLSKSTSSICRLWDI